jgi:Zn-finger nucleic acid-binding protein
MSRLIRLLTLASGFARAQRRVVEIVAGEAMLREAEWVLCMRAEQIFAGFVANEELEADSCPRCTRPTLRIGSIGENAIRVCSRCSGIFVSARELKELSKSQAWRRREEAAGAIADAVSEGVAIAPASYWRWLGRLVDDV